MAYTQNNKLQTRISLKYDSFANWTSNNPVLLKGEVAIAAIPVPGEGQQNLTGFQNLPNVVMKVGDGSTHYNDLKFVSALAADVYDWAKAADKPAYAANEIVGLQQFIEDYSDIDTNTQYTIVPVADTNGYKFELKYKDLADSAFKSFADPVYIDLTDADTRLGEVEEKLEELIGSSEGSISEMIDGKIAALNSVATQDAGADGLALSVTQVNGVITDITGSIAPNTYDAHGAAAAAEQAAKAHSDKNLEEAKSHSDKNLETAKGYADGLIDALDAAGVEGSQAAGTTITFVDKVSQANGIVSAELGELHFQSAYNASTNKAATMADVTAAVADLNGAMHFEGVSTTHPVNVGVTITAKPDYVATAGDVVIFVDDNGTPIEYVYDGAAWHQLGNESIAQKAIEALDVDDITVGADSTLSVVGEADGLIHATPVKIQIAQSQVTGLEKRLDDIEADLGTEGSLYKQVEANKAAIEVINGADTGKSMRTVAAEEAVAALDVLDAPDAAVAGKYVASVSQENGVITVTRADLPAIPSLELVEGTATTPTAEEIAVVADIDVDGHKITDTRVKVATAAGVAAAITKLNVDKDVSSNKHVMTGVSQVNGVIASIDEVALADIAFSGNVADLKQTAETYIVFDCGSSSVNI